MIENMRTGLDGVFGIFAGVMLLNVVIAIISEVWTDAGNHATTMFWCARLDFLSETSFFSNGDLSSMNQCVKYTPATLNISWAHDYPYNQVLSRHEYDHPEDHFSAEIAAKIREAHSLEATVKWIRTDFEVNGRSRFIMRLVQLKASLKWWIGILWYLTVIILGFLTMGLLWPRAVREFVLTVGNRLYTSTGGKEPMNNTNNDTVSSKSRDNDES